MDRIPIQTNLPPLTGTKQKIGLAANLPALTGAKQKFGSTLTVAGGTVENEGFFAYTVPLSGRSSAGVYRQTDGVLVRTLWSNKTELATGQRGGQWDGKLDDGTMAPSGSYRIDILTNAIQATWEGVLGNSSFAMNLGNTNHRGFQFIRGMVNVGNFMYAVQHFSEGLPSQIKIPKATNQRRTYINDSANTGMMSEFICADANRVYYSGYDFSRDDNSPNTGILATNITDDSYYTFSGGTPYKPRLSSITHSLAGFISDNTYHIAGLAVQPTGNFLLASYGAKNEVRIINKTTGAAVSTQTITNPRQMVCDSANNVWIISAATTVTKYSINATTGALTPGVSLTGLVQPVGINLNADGSSVVVCDGGSSQQVKWFSASAGGAATQTLGQPGGYASTSLVANDRFYFTDVSGGIYDSFVAYQSDGTFWVGDRGNYRAQHFAADLSYIDNIAYTTASYSSAVDMNDPTRVFCQFLEFKVDYSKPLQVGNGSWVLYRNWRQQLPAEYFVLNNLRQSVDFQGTFFSLATLGNGRTYATVKRESDQRYMIVELPPTGQLRVTSQSFAQAVGIGRDGSLGYTVSLLGNTPKTFNWKRRALTGFDTSNDPIWGAETNVATVTNPSDLDPLDFSGYPSGTAAMRTTGGYIPQFQSNLISSLFGTYFGYGWHLGAVKVGGTQWAFKTSYATPGPKYIGDYPMDGSYDVGNHAPFLPGNQQGYGGGSVTVAGRRMLWNYYGEFWKDSQTNMFSYYDESGLLINVFGTLANGQKGQPGFEGGVHQAWLVQSPVDPTVDYIYHTGEYGHSGVDRWRIDGTNTIAIQTAKVLPINASKSMTLPVTNSIDLLAGLPKDTTLPGATAGWQPSHVPNSLLSGEVFRAETSRYNYDRFKSWDLALFYRSAATIKTWSRDIGAVLPRSSWTLSSIIRTNTNDNQQGQANSQGRYFDLLDTAGKIIVRFYCLTGTLAQVYANTTKLAEGDYHTMMGVIIRGQQPLTLALAGGQLSASYAAFPTATNIGVFENGADPTRPDRVRVYFYSNISQTDDVNFVLQKLVFDF